MFFASITKYVDLVRTPLLKASVIKMCLGKKIKTNHSFIKSHIITNERIKTIKMAARRRGGIDLHRKEEDDTNYTEFYSLVKLYLFQKCTFKAYFWLRSSGLRRSKMFPGSKSGCPIIIINFSQKLKFA